MEESSKHGANTSKETQVGNFSLIIDETSAEPPGKGSRVDKVNARKGNTNLWRWRWIDETWRVQSLDVEKQTNNNTVGYKINEN